MITDMIVKSKLLDPIMKSFSNLFGGGTDSSGSSNPLLGGAAGGSGLPSLAPATATDITNALTGNNKGGGPNGTPGNPVHVALAQAGDTKLNGSSAMPVTFNSDGTTMDGGGADMSNSSFSDWDGKSLQPSQKWGSGHGGGVAAIGAGYGIGSMAGGLLGENQGNAGIGGALGGAVAALTAANPIAGAALSVLGGLVGGLFGPHETAADQPDLNDSTYQQETADLSSGVRNWGFNGTGVAAEQQYNAYAGNKNLSEQMADYSKNVNEASLNATQQALQAQIQALNPQNLAEGWGVYLLNTKALIR